MLDMWQPEKKKIWESGRRKICQLLVTSRVVVVMAAFLAFFCLFWYLCGEWSEWVSEASSERILWIVEEMRKFLRRESGRRKISWKKYWRKKKMIARYFDLLWNIWWFFYFFCDYWWGVDHKGWFSLELLRNMLDVGRGGWQPLRSRVCHNWHVEGACGYWVCIWGCKSWSGG